jgi:hypothetical protein
MAPQGTPYPYGVFQVISDVPRYSFSDDFEDYLIQFRLFSKDTDSAIEIDNMFDELKNVFDFAIINQNDFQAVSMIRENSSLIKREDVWQYTVLYRLLMMKDISIR